MTGAQDWAVTHSGTVRKQNQDAIVARADIGMWAVADGAGGHHTGEVASAMIVDALDAIPATLDLDACLNQVCLRLAAVHAALQARAAAQGGMIVSTVVVLLVRDGQFACVWAGDSRAYLLRDGLLAAITRDHSLVQAMIDAGTLFEAEAERHPQANVITRAVGSDEARLDLEEVTGRLIKGDRLLLCSDGLCKTLDAATLAALTADPADPAHRLVDAALRAGVRDNVTALVVQP